MRMKRLIIILMRLGLIVVSRIVLNGINNMNMVIIGRIVWCFVCFMVVGRRFK